MTLGISFGPWTWLEIAKLLSAPAAAAIFGVITHRTAKKFEHTQWKSQKLIEKRIASYDKIAPELNSLLCYFMYFGDWKDSSPIQMVKQKRLLDRESHLASPMFSPEFKSSFDIFLGLCFQTYNGWGEDARLRTGFDRRRDAMGDAWRTEWEGCFATERSTPEEISHAYSEVMRVFARDIGVIKK